LSKSNFIFSLIFSSSKKSTISFATISPMSFIFSNSAFSALISLSNDLYFSAKSLAVLIPTFGIPNA